VAEEMKLETNVVAGEAAFYGPKLDFMVKMRLAENGNWARSRLITIFLRDLTSLIMEVITRNTGGDDSPHNIRIDGKICRGIN